MKRINWKILTIYLVLLSVLFALPFAGQVSAVSTGENVTAPYFVSTAVTGTSPLIVSSTTKVDNLNADLLDGKHAYELGGGGDSTSYNAINYIVAAYNAPDYLKNQANFVCDGTADEVEIQEAIDSLPVGYWGSISLTSGRYNIDSTIYFKDFVKISGQGIGTLIVGNNLNDSYFASANQSTTCAGVVIEDMYFCDKDYAEANSIGVDFTNVTTSYIRIWACRLHIGIYGASTGSGASFHNTIESGTQITNVDIGIFCDVGANNWNIYNPRLQELSKGIIVSSGAVSIYNPAIELFTSRGIDLINSGGGNYASGCNVFGGRYESISNNATAVSIAANCYQNSIFNPYTILSGAGSTAISDSGKKTTIISSQYGAWNAYTPTVTAGGGTITSYSATGRYSWIGDKLFIQIQVTITDKGTAAGPMDITLPSGVSQKGTLLNVLTIVETGVNGYAGSALLAGTGATSITCYKYDGTTPFVNGFRWNITGWIDAQQN